MLAILFMPEPSMLDVVLYQPEIPPNTGNIIRLCANTGARLHLIEPMGFTLDDKQLRRAGLDYHEYAHIQVHASLEDYIAAHQTDRSRLFGFTTHATRPYTDTQFQTNDALLFGPETRGLPKSILATLADTNRLRIPMRAQSRSLNLSNAVSVAVYEAWRQLDFEVSP